MTIRTESRIKIASSVGEVWAYVGGAGDLSSAPDFDAVRAPRQPGSALKPFLYALAVDAHLLTAASLIEAAEIDGARAWGKFRHVTVPLLGPATLFLVVWSTINALQLFDEVYFLTKGGPGTATYVVVYYLYNLAFAQGIAGYAAAIAYVLLVAIMALTLIQLWVGRRWVHYAS